MRQRGSGGPSPTSGRSLRRADGGTWHEVGDRRCDAHLSAPRPWRRVVRHHRWPPAPSPRGRVRAGRGRSTTSTAATDGTPWGATSRTCDRSPPRPTMARCSRTCTSVGSPGPGTAGRPGRRRSTPTPTSTRCGPPRPTARSCSLPPRSGSASAATLALPGTSSTDGLHATYLAGRRLHRRRRARQRLGRAVRHPGSASTAADTRRRRTARRGVETASRSGSPGTSTPATSTPTASVAAFADPDAVYASTDAGASWSTRRARRVGARHRRRRRLTAVGAVRRMWADQRTNAQRFAQAVVERGCPGPWSPSWPRP